MVLEKASTGEAAIVEAKPAIDSDLITKATGQLLKYDRRMREDMTKDGELLPNEKARRAKKSPRIIALPEKPYSRNPYECSRPIKSFRAIHASQLAPRASESLLDSSCEQNTLLRCYHSHVANTIAESAAARVTLVALETQSQHA